MNKETMSHSTIAENFEVIRQRIATACERCGRAADSAALLAVSKTFPAETVRAAVEAGQILFGENRVQEAADKIPQLPEKLEWHLIGHLQKNKIRKALPLFPVIHSIDSLKLAQQVDRVAAELGLFPKVYLQVNIADDGAKFGFTVEQIEQQLDTLLDLEKLEIQGLMTIPAFTPEAEDSRKFFADLRELRDRLENKSGIPLPGLSMGMSHDFEVAIEEGATIVRVGSSLFGKRTQPAPVK
jgi:pyridoxal phosphate enzyme (YggS family)